jgi:osmoprotectant transport system permease protein
MSPRQVVTGVELPIALPLIFAGIRTSAVNVVATATIAPLAGVATLGEFILGENVYGPDGVLAGAILVALLALALEFSLAGLQRMLTSKGLKLRAA